MTTVSKVKYRSARKAIDYDAIPITVWRPEYTNILLSVHILHNTSLEQLVRLLARSTKEKSSYAYFIRDLIFDGYLKCVRQVDPTGENKNLPFVYSDTTKGRRYLETECGVPFRTLSHKPASSPNFLPHDLGMSEVMVSFMRTAELHNISLKHTYQITGHGGPFNHPVTVAHFNMSERTSVKPDQTFTLNEKFTYFPEYDRGSLPVRCNDITVRSNFRKMLAYTYLSTHKSILKPYGITSFCVPFIINAKSGTKAGAQTRIQNHLEKMPRRANRKLFYFIDPFTFREAGNDVSRLKWLRGDGVYCTLPGLA